MPLGLFDTQVTIYTFKVSNTLDKTFTFKVSNTLDKTFTESCGIPNVRGALDPIVQFNGSVRI